MSVIDTARESLLSQLEPLQREYADTKQQLDEIAQAKEQLEAALTALGGKPKSKAKAAAKTGKPYARKVDVMKTCRALVQANQPISKADLESLAKHSLGEDQGFNLSGVSLRLAECLASDTFAITTDGIVSIADNTPASMTNDGSTGPINRN